MPNYTYTAVNEAGQRIKNEITATAEQDVIQQLLRMQLTPVEIKKISSRKKVRKSSRRIKSKDVALFTKQLYTLLKAGVPILVSLNAIKEQNENSALFDVVEEIANEVEQGSSLHEAIAQFPKIFSNIYINSIKIGEMSGTLEASLKYLYKFLEEEDKLRKDIKKALRYPMLVVFGILVAFVVFTSVVIPKFIPIFSASGMELPFPTRMLIGIYHVVSSYGLFILGGLILLVAGAVLYVRTPKGLYQYHKLLLNLPIFGSLLKKASISRFAKTFYTMNCSGIPVLQAFETMQSTMDNEVYKSELFQITEHIKRGEGMANSLRTSHYFTPFVVEMIAIGEKSGALDDMLSSVSEYYDLEVDEAVKNLTSLIEPVVTVALGGIVLVLMLAIFLPMWNMMSLVH